MNHDISHCEGVSCPKKDNCYRHIAYGEAIYEKLIMFTIFTNPPYKNGGCKYFIPFKNEDKNQKTVE